MVFNKLSQLITIIIIIITHNIFYVNKKEDTEMKDLVFEMEKLLCRQKAISQLIGLLAHSADTGVAITNFREGIFVLYRLASENYDEMESIWENMMSKVTEKN